MIHDGDNYVPPAAIILHSTPVGGTSGTGTSSQCYVFGQNGFVDKASL